MNAPPTSGTAKVDVQASVGGCEFNLSVSVPAEPTTLDTIFPLLQILSDKIVSAAEQDSVKNGYPISCRKGCGACCRQLVPVSTVEARHIARLVDSMPEPRQSEIRGRFREARRRLEQAGIWDALSRRQDWPKNNVLPIGIDYFRLGIACPFLEDESCSIHLDRPMTCREYLVVSPAENCANPTPETVKTVNLPANVWVAAARCEPGAGENNYINWVPMIQALDWVQEHPEPGLVEFGPDLVRRVIENLAESNRPEPSDSRATDAASAAAPAKDLPA